MQTPTAVIILRFLVESCIEIGLVALVSCVMNKKERFNNFQDGFAMILAIITLFCLGFAPVYLIYVGRRLINKPHLLSAK